MAEERETRKYRSIQQISCPHCGALVHRGVVRCWNCLDFIHDELAEEFREMQKRPGRAAYRPLPRESEEQDGWSGVGAGEPPPPPPSTAHDGPPPPPIERDTPPPPPTNGDTPPPPPMG